MKSEFLETRSLSIPLSPEEYLKLSNPPLLIDVRSHVEFSLSHAPNAAQQLLNLGFQQVYNITGGMIKWP